MKFTYYTIIGKDVEMLKGHIANVKQHAGFDRLTCEKEFIVIIYANNSIPKAVTDQLVSICVENGVRPVVYQEQSSSWLENLYATWNLGYAVADEGWVFRSGSDEVHSFDSLPKIYDVAMRARALNPKILLNANTIEHSVRAMSNGNISRHIVKDFGDTFQNLRVDEFEKFCDELRNVPEELLTVEDSLRYWGRPGQFGSSRIRNPHNRTEGTSWLITKEDWRLHGPMPAQQGGQTGDVWLHDSLELAGYKDYIARDCIAYHFFRGESMHRFGG